MTVETLLHEPLERPEDLTIEGAVAVRNIVDVHRIDSPRDVTHRGVHARPQGLGIEGGRHDDQAEIGC